MEEHHQRVIQRLVEQFKDDLRCKIGERMQSRSLLLTAPRQLEWITENLPAVKPDEVLVQTSAGAISIGAELPQ